MLWCGCDWLTHVFVYTSQAAESWYTRKATLSFTTLFRAKHLFFLSDEMDGKLMDLVRGMWPFGRRYALVDAVVCVGTGGGPPG